jgi:hypothetical protein
MKSAARIVIGYTPPEVGVPDNVAVVSWLSVRLTPSVVPALIDGIGLQLVDTVKVNGVPAVAVAELALMIEGLANAGRVTTRLKVCVAGDPTPLLALSWSGYVPAVPQTGVPPNVAVPSPLSVKDIPVGNDDDVEMVGVGGPLAVVTKKLVDWPSTAPALVPLVNATPSGTVTIDELEVTVVLPGPVALAVAVLVTEPAVASPAVVV